MQLTTPILTRKVMNAATARGLEDLFQASSAPLTFGSTITLENTGFGGVRQTPANFFLMEEGETWSWDELSPEHHPHSDVISKALLCLHCDPFLGKILSELHRTKMCFSIQDKYFVEYLPGLIWIRKFNDQNLDRELNATCKKIALHNLDASSPTLWRYGVVVRSPSSSHETLKRLGFLEKSTQWNLWRNELDKACERVQGISFSPPTPIAA